MDRMVYIAMTGAKQVLQAQGIVAHNLANVSTAGFRADLYGFSSRNVDGPGYPTRVNAVAATSGFDHTVGSLQQSGRALDVAVKGEGWIAVQAPDGTEAYTRAGDLRIDPNGLLLNGAGHPVLGDSGPISLPPSDEVAIAPDGTISVVPQGVGPTGAAAVARIKLVNPPAEQLTKSDDGLVRLRKGTTAPADASVQLATGALESSNVNAARALVEMIEFSRLFDMQVKLLGAAEQNAQIANRMLTAA
jgi:flagellar basal-body rod protein FlgF